MVNDLMLKDLTEKNGKSSGQTPGSGKGIRAANDQTLLLWLEVAHDDIGRTIGKLGDIINAMRTIVTTA